MFLLKNLRNLEQIPLNLKKDEIFKEVFNILEVSNLNNEEYMEYERNLLDQWNENAVMET